MPDIVVLFVGQFMLIGTLKLTSRQKQAMRIPGELNQGYVHS